MSKAGNILRIIIVWAFVAMALACSIFCINYFMQRRAVGVEVEVIAPMSKEMLSDSIISLYLAEEEKYVFGKRMRYISDTLFTNKLEKIESIRDVNVMSLVNNKLIIRVEQKEPIAELIVNGKDGFYLTKEGEVFKSSDYYGDYRLLKVDGLRSSDIEEEGNKKLSTVSAVLDYILNEPDLFMYKVTSGLNVNEKTGDVELESRVKGHKIIVGKVENMSVKSNNLKAFYEALGESDLERYVTLNLKFENQVIAITK